MFNIIVACCKNRGIGINNTLPWHIKPDLKKFKKLTIGKGYNSVIMGRKTWDSLPDENRPLNNRENIILSRKRSVYEGGFLLRDINLVPIFCRNRNYEENWIIGGEKIYKNFLSMGIVDNIYVTEIMENYKCDTYFPLIDETKYKLDENIEEEEIDGINIVYKRYYKM